MPSTPLAMVGVLVPVLLFLVGPASQGVLARGILQAPAPAPLAAGITNNLAALSAAEAHKMLCARTITAVQYVEALFDQVDEWMCVNAWAGSYNESMVLAEAAAIDAKYAAGMPITPLCGLPLGVKDSINVVGYPTTAGTPALEFAYPYFSAPLVDQWKAGNGIIMGKTKLHELSGGGTNASPYYGAVLNPYDPTRVCGGSTGGSGAALAARMVPVALCEDTAGSCRHPAALTGTFGLRPTMSCYNFSDGMAPATFTRDTPGIMTRTMEDMILLDPFLRQTSRPGLNGANCSAPVDMNLNLRGVRIGIPAQWYGAIEDDILKPNQNILLSALNMSGVVLVPIDVDNLMRQGDMVGNGGDWQGPRELARWLYVNNFTQSVVDVYQAASHPLIRRNSLNSIRTRIDTATPEAWIKFLAQDRPAYIQMWRDMFTNYNISALLYPTYPVEPNPIDQAEPFVMINGKLTPRPSFTTHSGQATFAGLSFPIGLTANKLPQGMQLNTPPGQDGLLMSMGLAMQKLVATIPALATPLPPPPACAGCQHTVINQQATWNASTPGPLPAPGGAASVFKLLFRGECANKALTTYGRGNTTNMMVTTQSIPDGQWF